MNPSTKALSTKPTPLIALHVCEKEDFGEGVEQDELSPISFVDRLDIATR